MQKAYLDLLYIIIREMSTLVFGFFGKYFVEIQRIVIDNGKKAKKC